MENPEKKAAYCYNFTDWLMCMLSILLLYSIFLLLPPSHAQYAWLSILPLAALQSIIDKVIDPTKHYLLKKGLSSNDIAAGKTVRQSMLSLNLIYFCTTVLFTLPLVLLLKKLNEHLVAQGNTSDNIIYWICIFIIFGSNSYLACRINLYRHYHPKSKVST